MGHKRPERCTRVDCKKSFRYIYAIPLDFDSNLVFFSLLMFSHEQFDRVLQKDEVSQFIPRMHNMGHF